MLLVDLNCYYFFARFIYFWSFAYEVFGPQMRAKIDAHHVAEFSDRVYGKLERVGGLCINYVAQI